MAAYAEAGFGFLLRWRKGNDAKMVTTAVLSASAASKEPSIAVTSPDLGASGATLVQEHTTAVIGGEDRFPSLKWEAPSLAAGQGDEVAEYMLIVEDPDAPLSTPPLHGIYYAIMPERTSVDDGCFKKVEGGEASNLLAGGFKYGKNRRGNVYSGPRAPYLNGEHRYLYTVIALKEKLDQSKMSEMATPDELQKESEGKILAWGQWIGMFERQWK